MTRAGAHGATAAKNSSDTGSRQGDGEEGVGLLAAAAHTQDEDSYHYPGQDQKSTPRPKGPAKPLQLQPQERLIVHPGEDDDDNSLVSLPLRTPRTPNRVRFDLRPTIVENNSRYSTDTTTTASESRSAQAQNGHTRSRESLDFDPDPDLDFDFDLDDPLSSRHRSERGSNGSHAHRQQRIPLLTGIEAPSVTVSNQLFGEHESAEAWHLAEQRRPKSSLPAAFMNMANSIIGAGIIGQPYAMRQAGLGAGIVLLVVLTVVVDWTIRLIVINSKLSGATSFQGTVERCFGRTGLIAISVAQWAFAFGGMVAFGVIVGDSIPSVLRQIWPGLKDVPVLGVLADRRWVIVVFTIGVSYPLALYRDIAKLAKASSLALLSMAVIVVTVVVQGMLVPSEDRGQLKDWKMLVVNDGIFQAIGVISFAFVCHHNSLLIYGSLEKPTMDRFAVVTHFSTGISMLACLLMALSGFLIFGDRTLGNVLNNFPSDNTMVNIARLCFGLNMLTTLPLEAFVCREVMLNYYFPGEPFSMNLHLLFTTSLVFSAMVLSLLTCDLGSVFDLVGGTSAAAMAYILPPLCYVKLTTRSWRTYAAWGVVVFGCVVMAMSLFEAIGKMITGEGDTKQCY